MTVIVIDSNATSDLLSNPSNWRLAKETDAYKGIGSNPRDGERISACDVKSDYRSDGIWEYCGKFNIVDVLMSFVFPHSSIFFCTTQANGSKYLVSVHSEHS